MKTNIMYQRKVHECCGIKFITNSKISQIWCIMGLKRGKIDALCHTFWCSHNAILLFRINLMVIIPNGGEATMFLFNHQNGFYVILISQGKMRTTSTLFWYQKENINFDSVKKECACWSSQTPNVIVWTWQSI